jgi:molybdopterin/thiamine biosynthesis adenylyltransferase
MKHDRSPLVATLDQASLDQFVTELVRAGYEPIPGLATRWRGPIHPEFRKWTNARDMEILIQDGWPVRHPRIYVPGLQLEHVNHEGEVCLWRDDDPAMDWVTLAGINRRIEAWCDSARSGFRQVDAALDAHLYFRRAAVGLAVIDTEEFGGNGGLRDGAFEAIYASRVGGALRLTVRQMAGDVLKGRWYYRSRQVQQPRDVQSFRSALTAAQQRHFDNGLQQFREGKRGALDLLVLMWETGYGMNVLVLVPELVGEGNVELFSIEAARVDVGTLKRRSGPDADALLRKTVALFGAGAVGSHVALCLSGAGLGSLTLVDGDLLRPGNVVRHAVGHSLVGYNKADAVRQELATRSSWTTVQAQESDVWSPQEILNVCQSNDLVIDATGNAAFSVLISQVAEGHDCPLVSVSLYRAGRVARVRRQWRGTPAIYRRADLDVYPLIPAGNEEETFLETGCSTPVNLAPPHVVLSAAALACQISVDALLDRAELADEIIDVYRPLPEEGFQRFTRRLVA